MRSSRRKLSEHEIWKLALAEIEPLVGDDDDEPLVPPQAPLWQPFPVMNGRGITLPDGRVVSPQQAALESEADELLFGGEPGGGKSFLLLGLALTQHRNSIIFRRIDKELDGAEGLVEKARSIVGTYGRWSGRKVKLQNDTTVEFGSMQHESDRLKFQGRAHDLKCFDELTSFTFTQYRFVIGWLRTHIPGQRTRVVATANPPTNEEGQWVVAYWGPWLNPNHPNPAKPGELRWFVVDEQGKDIEVDGPDARVEVKGRKIKPRSRTFIPASVDDNPLYMATDYATVLDNLPEPLRSQMRFGNFGATIADDQWQVIPRAWVIAAQARWRADARPAGRPTAVGIDPSRGGQDEFVVTERYDNWVAPQHVHAATEAPDGDSGARLVIADLGGAEGQLPPDLPLQIDVSGEAGPSVYDSLGRSQDEGGPGLNAVALNGSRKSKAYDKTGKLKFFNKRAEFHWRMREALDPESGLDIALPPDPQLRSDLCAPRWEMTLTGAIKIEDKDKIKKRIGRSPDRGESLMYAFAGEGAELAVVGAEIVTDATDLSVRRSELDRLKKRLGL